MTKLPINRRSPIPRKSKNTEVSLVRSSAAEYLTFVAASGQGGVEAIYANESIWLTQKMMGVLYDVNVRTVNGHLKKIFADSELQEDSVIRKFRITASDGKVPFDDRFNPLARVDDLSKPLMQGFLEEVGSALTADAPGLSVEALARQMNVAGGPTESPWPKNVGLLFFNETPERFFPAVQIDVVWFPDGAGGNRF